MVSGFVFLNSLASFRTTLQRVLQQWIQPGDFCGILTKHRRLIFAYDARVSSYGVFIFFP